MAIEKWLHSVAKTGSYNDLTNKPQITSEVNVDDSAVIASAKSVKKLNDAINGKANISHTHTKAQITDMPTSMKNPTSLTVQFNGTTNKTYDGSTAQTVNITPSSIGASASNHTHNYAGSSSAGGAATTALACSGTSANSSKLGGTFTASGTPSTTEKTNLVGMINEVFQSASNGKSSIATAITSKGITASSSETFEVLANKIKQITTGVDTSDATATADKLLSGQTAYVKGSKITGTMANLSALSTITHESGNSTKVVKSDGLFIGNNTDGVRRVSLRYNGPNGFITGNTLFGLPESQVASSLGITGDKILSGNTICGVNGNIPDRGQYGQQCTSNTTWENRLYLRIPEGRYGNGSYDSNGGKAEVYETFPNVANLLGITANKIVSGNNICGVWGSATVESMGGKRYAEGSVYANYDCKTGTINLPFTPRVVLMQLPDKIYASSIWTNVMDPIRNCYAVNANNYDSMYKTTSGKVNISVGTNCINWTITDWSAGASLKYYAWE